MFNSEHLKDMEEKIGYNCTVWAVPTGEYNVSVSLRAVIKDKYGKNYSNQVNITDTDILAGRHMGLVANFIRDARDFFRQVTTDVPKVDKLECPCQYLDDGRNCGFDGKGRFVRHNHNCITLLKLWQGDISVLTENGDASMVSLPLQDGSFAILTRYKHRGRIENAIVLENGATRQFTLADAKSILER